MKPRTIAGAIAGAIAAVLLALAAWLVRDAPSGAAGGSGPECTAGERSCFQFWTGCAAHAGALAVSVRSFGEAEQIGLRDADIKRAVETRLRAAGIYGPELPTAKGFFDIEVHFDGPPSLPPFAQGNPEFDEFADEFNRFGVFSVFINFHKGVMRDDYGFLFGGEARCAAGVVREPPAHPRRPGPSSSAPARGAGGAAVRAPV